MFRDGYDAIFIGTGVWNPNKLNIKGISLGNVHFAIDYLKNPDSYTQLGNRVAIIGAGNVAMDAARTIVRKNNAKVDIVFHHGEQDMTALKEEIELARVDGINFNYYLNALEIKNNGLIVAPVKEIIDDEGNKRYENEVDKAYLFEADSVIIAIGQGALNNIVKNTKEIDTNKKGLIETTDKGATSRPGVYAAGDVVSGAKTVVQAVAATKDVADEIDDYIRQKYHLPSLKDEKSVDNQE